MYTGIVKGTFAVASAERTQNLLRYEVELPAELRTGLVVGASVSIDGVCQTVTGIKGARIGFDAIPETLQLTTLGSLAAGARVTVERSARIGDEIGGHDVAGHIIGTGEVLERRQEGDVCDLKIGVPANWMRYITRKGFIAIDGSSLTVGERNDDGWFMLHLIPETLRLTNLGRKDRGDRVNIELDARTVTIVDTVERLLKEHDTAR
ncbi:MAG: riboflavin synthase subunit alpha [Deltaproteobacteria bacterium]